VNESTRAVKVKIKPPIDESDRHLYLERHLIECCINKNKRYRRVFTCFEKLSKNYLGIPEFRQRAYLVTLRKVNTT
jgi:transposase